MTLTNDLDSLSAAWVAAQKNHCEAVSALYRQTNARESWIGPIQHDRLMAEVTETYQAARLALGTLNSAPQEVQR